MDFAGYFLIVMEFVQWAKNNGIPVGPGRGSGAGSVVAWALGITDLDPIEYDLLFERFLNPERVSMPDFDIDFCMEGRDRVIAHVADIYGEDAVSQIITFGTMAAKAVVRDVARVQGKPYSVGDRLSRLIPPTPGMTLARAMREQPDLKEYVDGDEDAQEILEMAYKLEGINPQRRQARRRACDRAGPPHRFHAVVSRPGTHRFRPADAIRQGRRGNRRPGQVRFSRSAHLDDHRLGGEIDQ